MTRQFTLPDLGEGVKEGQVLRLLVAEGDRVEEDQLLVEVETDKSAVEIPSPYSGVIERWHVEEQQVVNVGDLMVTFGDGAAAPATTTKPAARADSAAAGIAATPPARRSAGAGASPGARPKPASPAVRKLARALGVDLDRVEGSGPGGRVVRADVERAAGAPPAAAPATARPAPTAPAAPLAAPAPAAPEAPAAPPEIEGVDGADAFGPVRRAPISKTRRAIAAIMTHSVAAIPHVTDTDDADVTELDHLRRGYNESAPPEKKLGLLPFVVRAVARALQRHPVFNASYDESAGEIVYKRYVNIAVGVHTDRGLVAPVVRDADRRTVPEIHEHIATLAERARAGTFALDDTRGATYTVSNAGAVGGSRYSTPIITHPQVAVLALGRSRSQPWVVDGRVVPRLIMPLSHSMDHRLIDGALEIAFMKQLIGDLENPARLML